MVTKKGVRSIKVAISGYFDPIHEGHLDHIEESKKLGDYLIAFAGTEHQCLMKHGDYFHTWESKVRLLKKLGVDEVVPSILDENGSCAPAILKYKPDIYAKGNGEVIPEAEIQACQMVGCKVMTNVGKRLNRSRRYFESKSK